MAETPQTNGRRSFIAVPIPAEVRAGLFAACAALGVDLPGVRWQRKIENLHVTIRFLGNVADDRLDDLAGALARGLAGTPCFEVGVQGVGGFPSARRANVIWAGVQDETQDGTQEGTQDGTDAQTGGLRRIAELVDGEVALWGGPGVAERESRPFRAHVTLGRAKVAADLRAVAGRLADSTFGRFTVDEVHLYESQLGRQGSTYVLRARAGLRPRGGARGGD